MNRDCGEAAALIARSGRRGAATLVAVDGRSGVGKSTFAAALAAAGSTARIVEGDAFYAGGLKVWTDTAERRADACIDRPKLRSVLENLKAGRSATYRPFDWDAFDGSLSLPAVTVQPSGIVIVEGVYSAHPELADLLDVSILLTAPDAVRLGRLMQREGTIGPWERQWYEAEDWYFANVVKPGDFDLILE
jgi:uridine kinase